MNILPSQFGLLRRSLDLAQVNQQVVSQNIANVNTPNYKTKEAAFTDVLAANGPDHEAAGIAVRQTNDPIRRDGNNVDVDREIGRLNKASLLFRTYAELLSTRLEEVRQAMELR